MFEAKDQADVLNTLVVGDVVCMGTLFLRMAGNEKLTWKVEEITPEKGKAKKRVKLHVYFFEVLMWVAVATIDGSKVSWGVVSAS